MNRLRVSLAIATLILAACEAPQAGPQGEPGPQGIRGLRGFRGAPGDQGKQGPPGVAPALSVYALQADGTDQVSLVCEEGDASTFGHCTEGEGSLVLAGDGAIDNPPIGWRCNAGPGIQTRVTVICLEGAAP